MVGADAIEKLTHIKQKPKIKCLPRLIRAKRSINNAPYNLEKKIVVVFFKVN